MKIRTFAVALALAGAPALLSAQQETPRDRAGQHQPGEWQGRRRGGFDGQRQRGEQALLRYRQQLGLTDAQVSRLQAIHQRLQQQNAPIMQRIEAARQQAGLPDFRRERGQAGQQRAMRRQRQDGEQGQRPQLTEQQRQAFQRFREQVRPLQEQLRQNRQAAMRETQSVLTERQREQVRQLIQQHRGRHGGQGGFRGQRSGDARP
jgi:hypothetical protein